MPPHSFCIRAFRKAGFVRSSRSYCSLSFIFCCGDQDSDTSPGLVIGGCFTVTVRRCCAWASADVGIAIAVRQTATIASVVAMLMTIAVLLCGCSCRLAAYRYPEQPGRAWNPATIPTVPIFAAGDSAAGTDFGMNPRRRWPKWAPEDGPRFLGLAPSSTPASTADRASLGV